MGFAFIEAGFPESNPKDAELFRALEADPPPRAQIAAFGMTRRRGARADEDIALRVLAESFAPVATIVGKTWDLHLDKVLRVDRDENLRMIDESIAFLRAEGKRVFYDAEHFFDGYADRPRLRAALPADGRRGGRRVRHPVRHQRRDAARRHRGGDAPRSSPSSARRRRSGIHTHDDAGCAVANSLVAVNAGARQVQGTLNGYGERCGNANLVSIVPSLQLKLGLSCVDDDDLRLLTRLAHDAAEIVNLPPDTHAPYVGRFAFAHKGGMHVAGVSLDPDVVRAPRARRSSATARTCSSRSSRGGRRSARSPRSTGSSWARTRSPARSRGSRISSTAATRSRPRTRRSSCSCAPRRARSSPC